jgi:hypothetical protein
MRVGVSLHIRDPKTNKREESKKVEAQEDIGSGNDRRVRTETASKDPVYKAAVKVPLFSRHFNSA